MKKISQIVLTFYISLVFILFPLHSVSAFTVGEERELGEKLLYAVRKSFTILDEPDLQQYIEKLGKEVLDVAGIQFFDYHFFVINNKEFNAFAAPSGLVFFNTGLIEKVKSEDELVSVLAHEVGHVVKRHISSRMEKGKKITLATLGLIIASLALGGGAATQAIFAGSIAAGQTANLHYSRLDEEEADLLAYDWMKKLHRNPDGQVRMLQTMRQIARYRSGMVPQYLLTHPNPETRLDYVQSLIDSDSQKLWNSPDSGNNDFEFLRFKYRILSQTKESNYLRGYYSSIISSSKSTDFDSMMAKYGMAQLDRVENNYAYSLKLMEEVIAYFNDKEILAVDKGLIEYEGGDAENAYETLLSAYEKDRNNLYSAFSLAKVCFNLGMLKKAEDLYEEVMYKMPEFSKVYFDLGRLSATKGKSAETNYYLGKYYLYEGKLKLSRKNLTEAAKEDADIAEELRLDAKRSIDIIDRLEKD